MSRLSPLLVILIAIVSALMAAAMSESTRPSDGRCRRERHCRIEVVQLTKAKWQNSSAFGQWSAGGRLTHRREE